MRGVHKWPKLQTLSNLGSSPHTRGPRQFPGAGGGSPGFIPACAGSTGPGVFWPVELRDHPRMRGVHGDGLPVADGAVGSSPHARGPPGLEAGQYWYDRIIPACAGSTETSAAEDLVE